MNQEERAKKWTQDIPELDGLTLQQRVAICNQVAKKSVSHSTARKTILFDT